MQKEVNIGGGVGTFFKLDAIKNKPTLPDAPSKLINLAIDDLEKVEKSNKFEVDMSTWVEKFYEDYETSHKAKGAVCSVCLAGSVMVKTLKVEKEISNWDEGDSKDPSDFDDDTSSKLSFLDDARGGYFESTREDLFEDYPFLRRAAFRAGLVDFSVQIHIPAYEHDRAGFKKAMRNQAKLWEKMGM